MKRIYKLLLDVMIMSIILRFISISLSYIFLVLLILMPYELYMLNLNSPIFAGIELIIIYYASTYYRIAPGIIFIFGLLLDQLYNTPLGVHFLVLIIGDYAIIYLNNWFNLKHHIVNLILFPAYVIILILAKLFLLKISGDQVMIDIDLLFYILITIFAYPIISIIISVPFQFIYRK